MTEKLSSKYEPGSFSRFLPCKREFLLTGVACSGNKFMVSAKHRKHSWCIFPICCTVSTSPDLHFSPFPCNSSNAYILEPLSLFEIATLCADSVNLPCILLQCAVFPQLFSCETKPRQPPWQRSSVVPRTVSPVSYKDHLSFRQSLAHQFVNWQQ